MNKASINQGYLKKILFVSPESDINVIQTFKGKNAFGKKAMMPPLALATLNALTSKEYETYIWDEETSGFITDSVETIEKYDIIALTGYRTHRNRMLKIAQSIREIGKIVVAGGADVTASPDSYREYFDVLFLGEGENIWPQFLKDYLTNEYKDEYLENDNIDLSTSPEPNWGNLTKDMSKQYLAGAVQSSRGCPFRCNFCNVWQVFGKTTRLKPIEQVIREIQVLIDNGFTTISFCVDNLIAKVNYAKELVREIIELNKSYANKIVYYTELTLNVGKDDELLALLAKAGFASLFIGIESPIEASLKESQKHQNTNNNLVETCQKIMSYGLLVEGSMIVGFDQDPPDIFERHFDFLMEANIPIPMMHILKVRQGTGLWKLMEEQNRILNFDTIGISINTYIVSNLKFKNFSREEIHLKFIELFEKLLIWENFYKRTMGFLNNINKIKVNAQGNYNQPLPPELQEVVSDFEIEQRSDVEHVIRFTLSKFPQLIFTIVTLLLRYKSLINKVPIMKKEIIDHLELTKQLDL